MSRLFTSCAIENTTMFVSLDHHRSHVDTFSMSQRHISQHMEHNSFDFPANKVKRVNRIGVYSFCRVFIRQQPYAYFLTAVCQVPDSYRNRRHSSTPIRYNYVQYSLVVCIALIKQCCLISKHSSHYIHYHCVFSFPKMVFLHRHRICGCVRQKLAGFVECDIKVCLPITLWWAMKGYWLIMVL